MASPSNSQTAAPTPGSSSRLTRLVNRLTPSNSNSSLARSSSNHSLYHQSSPNMSDGEEAIQPPEFVSDFMNMNQFASQSRSKSSLGFHQDPPSSLRKSASWLSSESNSVEQPARFPKQRRQSEEGTASSPRKATRDPADRPNHRRSPTAAALSAFGLPGWNKSKDALVFSLKRTNSSGHARQPGNDQSESGMDDELEHVTRPTLTRLPSLESTHTQPSVSATAIKTPGGSSAATASTINLGAGLSESSKRFRSAFRLQQRVKDGSSLRKPQRAIRQPVDENGVLVADISESDRSPEDHISYSSASQSSPEEVALVKSLEKVQLVDDIPPSSSRQASEPLRPIFAASRLQQRLEAASLVAPSPPYVDNDTAPPIPAKSVRRSPPYGTLRASPSPPSASAVLAARAYFDIPRSFTDENKPTRSSIDGARKISPPPKRAPDSRRDGVIMPSSMAANPSLQIYADEEDWQSKQVQSKAQTALSEGRHHRPNGSITLKSSQLANEPFKIHVDAENVNTAPAKHALKPSANNGQSLKKPLSQQSIAKAPLLDLPPVRQQHSSSGPVPADRIVPLKAASISPPERNPEIPSLPLASAPATQSAPAPNAIASSGAARKAVQVVVNGKQYLRSALIGKGGSSRVYRITDREHNVFAFKRVELSKGDLETYTSFCNEIELLKRLSGHDRIIQLIDAEVNDVKRTLVMVLELGEIDLNSLLQEKIGKRVSMNFIRQTWEQMLECVKVVHDAGIVHTDLKPANFVLVKGALKLIDFGIAKAIPSDTTNIARDQQIGTANYMSPEALCDSGRGLPGERLMKMGRASDVWSLGCILYQMVYGTTPFACFRNLPSKMMAIQNPLHKIDFPSHAIPKSREGVEAPDNAVVIEQDLLRVLKSCLRFDSKQRSTIPELLEDPFLRGDLTVSSGMSAELVAALVARTLAWSNGRQPGRMEQERFVENVLSQLGNPATELGRLSLID